jgi:hypothetical protein
MQYSVFRVRGEAFPNQHPWGENYVANLAFKHYALEALEPKFAPKL